MRIYKKLIVMLTAMLLPLNVQATEDVFVPTTEITDAVPEEDPSIAEATESDAYLNGNIEHSEDDVVNVFEDAGKIESLPETAPKPTEAPLPGEEQTAGKSTVPRQDQGIKGCIVRIRTGYRFDDGSFAEWANGTGFLVGKDCILTTRSVAVISQNSTLYENILSTQRKAYLDQGIDLLDFSAVKKSIVTYAVADQGDVVCKIDEKAGDDSFVILYPEQRINAYGTVKFAKEKPNIGDEVCVVGTEVQDVETPLLAEDFYIKTAKMVETRKSGASDFIEFDGVFNNIPAGCPLVNKDQYVIGLITDGTDGRGSAVDLDSMKKVLNQANVEYLSEGDDSTVDIETLRSLLEQAEQIDRSIYTADSLDALDKAYATAKALSEEDSPSRNRVEKEAKILQTAIEGLTVIDRSAEIMERRIKIIAALVVLAAIAIIVPIFLRRRGKEQWEIDEDNQMRSEQRKEKLKSLVTKPQKEKREKPAKKAKTKAEKKEKDNQEKENFFETQEPYDDYEGDEGETTVLKSNSNNAVLINLDTREEIEIKGKVFVLGKSASADYQIHNDTVSRRHCLIRHRGEEYYVEDTNSTNGTYIDDEQVEPKEQVRIKNGQILKLSNVEFRFKQ